MLYDSLSWVDVENISNLEVGSSTPIPTLLLISSTTRVVPCTSRPPLTTRSPPNNDVPLLVVPIELIVPDT